MGLVNHSTNNLINGVSQQSPALRLDNQVSEQINCFSDVTKGLTIRNGIELTNVLQMDLDTSNIIEFTLDGEKISLSLDPTAVSPLVHIPLSADITALGAAITDLNYFQNIQKGDIRVLEDKDKVYILNTARKVGEVELGSAYVDVIVSNDTLGGVDEDWSVGEYTLTITAVEDPSAAPATASLVVTVDSGDTLADIAATINGNAALVAETGECYVTGNVSNYRITFHSIPIDFIAPTVVGLETVDIEGFGIGITEDSGWVWQDFIPVYQVYSYQGVNQFYWNNVEIASTASSSVTSGGYIFEKGAAAPHGNKYYIRRYKNDTLTREYSLEVQTPDEAFDGNSISDYPQEAMIWVSGVTSNQTYDVRIEYHSISGGGQLFAPTSTTYYNASVGTTVSNIKLNWVAGTLQTAINGHADFTATQYENAIHIQAGSDYVIDEIIVTNSFDNSSISGAIQASKNNDSGILDISTLPPTFVENFTVRVGDEETVKSNYYLKYVTDFKGWKEAGLDQNRALDFFTMPHIIDKEEIRKTGIVTIEHGEWVKAAAGDSESNKSPSFVDKNINDIFFYGSRLGVATDDTLVMSAINSLDTFYRTTASQTVISDRVDIKLDSSKVGFDTIKHVTTFNQSLFINTGTTQSKLLVNTAFDLTSARLSEVSSYSLGSGRPLPVESGLYFAISDDSYTNVVNYQSIGNDSFEIEDLTKHCPTYIEGTIDKMVYSKNLTVVSVNENRKVLYIQNRFSKGGEMLQNSWHKWTLPYDLDHMHFFNDELKIIMSTEYNSLPYVVIGKYNVKPSIVGISDNVNINWSPYLDLHTTDKTDIENFPEFLGIDSKNGVRYDNVVDAYASTLVNQIVLSGTTADTYSLTSPVYYWRVSGDTNTIVFNDGTAIVFGNNTLTEYDDGGYRYYKGADQGSGDYGVYRATITASSFYTTDITYGIPFLASITLSQIISRMETENGPMVMNYSTLMLRRMRLFLAKSGPFRVVVTFKDRKDYEIVYNGAKLGVLVLGTATAEDTTFNFPANGKSDMMTITIETDSSTPFNLLATEWQGQLITKGRNI